MIAQLPFACSRTEANPTLVHKIASCREEREAAFQVIYDAYLEAGLCEPNPWGIRVTPFHLLDTTTTFVAVERGQVVSTISLVEDGELGLPMESIYPREVAERRERGLRLAEVSCLADHRPNSRCSLARFCELARIMIQFARVHELDEVLVAVHPKQARFYTRCLWFEPIAGVTVYPTVRNRPAVALSMDFAQVDRKGQESPERYERFFGNPIPAEELAPCPMSASERRFFSSQIDPAFQRRSQEEKRAGRSIQTFLEQPLWGLWEAAAPAGAF